ncbi:hypothetical protein G7Y89_g8695 [Cudoniella acicularis]|uniref:Uncharacterized protein n=1 Tax=Cudoniella acicularis TaxID=354080 RepID=A0A8H4RIX4_9HELO|nr:hypothetical protein G7Y89_g8695 [Cudoniella acicularis]
MLAAEWFSKRRTKHYNSITTTCGRPIFKMKVAWLPISLRETLRCAYTPRPIISARNCTLNSRPRQFTTASRLQAGIAASEIKFPREENRDGQQYQEQEEEDTFFARVVPTSPSYFTAQPLFTDDLLALQNLLRRYSSLPTVKPGEQPRVAWRALSEYRDAVGESVKASKYHKIVQVLQRLNQIHPSLMPADVQEALNEYKRDINPYQNVPKVTPVNSMGVALGAGRRKASTARAWVVEGTGEVLVNGKTLAEAFGRVHDRESVIWALKSTNRIDKYNVWALATGGGTTGQAEALTLAVGKALLAHEPALKPALRRDRNLDSQVTRTRFRPMARKAIPVLNAYMFWALQAAVWIAIASLLFPNQNSKFWTEWIAPSAFFGAVYPYMKRVTYYPQVILGLSLSWGTFLGCGAMGIDPLTLILNEPFGYGAAILCIFATNIVWIVKNDMIYAHRDLEDDIKAGILSMAPQQERHVDLHNAVQAIHPIQRVRLYWCADDSHSVGRTVCRGDVDLERNSKLFEKSETGFQDTQI